MAFSKSFSVFKSLQSKYNREINGVINEVIQIGLKVFVVLEE